MQNNVIPVAAAKDIGLIGMKVFADGAMYTKNADWSREPSDVIRLVGSKETPHKPLIQYSLTTPGISTLIIGIGQISDDAARCQLTQNIESSQIKPGALSDTDREAVEEMAGKVKQGKTNYFQQDEGGLTEVQSLVVKQSGEKTTQLTWNTAYAGNHPLARYEIQRNGEKVGEVLHKPQISLEPFMFEDNFGEIENPEYKVITIDSGGNSAETEATILG